ncbi:site-2 protease family protein [Schaalia sp. ZJ405]|uniref:M50 family metallopeptidase n=1 Tax=Schaalia sp. ZJ405 TaxID=2709403 RepID=UPI0013EBA863|nr:M50 family metallopeptidase [Schaalia sp. ZJ405]QPK82008.1 site-2 protease family protein [Schaalia sp. ZJ405]
MSWIWGVLVVAVGLVISVALHELGHMIPAKRFGALVPDYSIGFGRVLFSKQWGETRVNVRAIPLGGFVRILGMYAPAKQGTRTVNSRGRTTLAEEARQASRDELGEHSARAFYLLRPWQKIIVMVSGPLMNLIISIALMFVVMVGIGSPTATLRLDEAAPTVSTASGTRTGPAYEAGLRAGDTIRGVDGAPIGTWREFQEKISSGTSQSVAVTFERDGVTQTVDVVPVISSAGGRVVGVRSAVDYVPASVSSVAEATWVTMSQTAAVVVRLPLALWDVGVSLFTDEPRDASGVMSIVGVGRVAGEVTASPDTTGTGDWRPKVAVLLSLLASVNMALFVFNLIPLPPLDGGHILGAVYEGGARLVARLRGRPDPGPADTAKLVPLTWVMASLLVAMTILLVVADIVDPIRMF